MWLSGSKDGGCIGMSAEYCKLMKFTSETKLRLKKYKPALIACDYGDTGNENLIITAFEIYSYCKGFAQHVARQQLCKHGPTCNNRGSCVFCRSDRCANILAG
jgi:hypothetical protein